VERCQALLEATSDTLRELNEVLLRETHQLHTLLQDIGELAVAAQAHTAEQATERVSEQVDRVAAWGSARQRAWSEYYQYVHRYLRDVVRLDPARALTQRLREQLTGQTGKGFALIVASAPPIKLLRAIEQPPEQKPPVKRPREPREKVVNDAETHSDPRAELEERVREALREGVRDLSEVTTRVTTDMPETQRFLAAGRVVEAVAKLAKPQSTTERPWVPVNDEILIEEWHVANAGGGET
jgi:chromosome partition protein MukF